MRKTTLALAVLAAACVLASPASAAISVGADQTFGSLGYRGTKANASLDVTDALYVTPTFSTFRTDQSSGSYYQGGLRVGYETGPFSFGVSGAFVPKNDDYSQTSEGADLTVSLSPGSSKHGHRMAGPASESNDTFGYGLAGVDIGGAVNHISHRFDFPGSSGTVSKYNLGQTDLTAFVGAKFLITEVSANVSRSVYDKTLTGTGGPQAPFLALGDFAAVESGLPDSSWSGKIKWKTLPFVRPYVAYTHTNFKLGVPSSNATEIGGNVGLDMLNVKGAYGHYSQSGVKARDYFTLAASLNFGG